MAVDGYPVLLSGHPGLFEVGPQHHVVEGVVEGGQGVEGIVVKPHCGRVRRVRHLNVPTSVSEQGQKVRGVVKIQVLNGLSRVSQKVLLTQLIHFFRSFTELSGLSV